MRMAIIWPCLRILCHHLSIRRIHCCQQWYGELNNECILPLEFENKTFFFRSIIIHCIILLLFCRRNLFFLRKILSLRCPIRSLLCYYYYYCHLFVSLLLCVVCHVHISDLPIKPAQRCVHTQIHTRTIHRVCVLSSANSALLMFIYIIW